MTVTDKYKWLLSKMCLVQQSDGTFAMYAINLPCDIPADQVPAPGDCILSCIDTIIERAFNNASQAI